MGTDNDNDEVADFFTAGMIPIAIAVRVTTQIDSNLHITKIGTPTDDDCFGNFGNGDLDEVNDTVVCRPVAGAGTGNGASFFGQNTELKFTYSGTPSAGALRLVLYYYEITAPTS